MPPHDADEEIVAVEDGVIDSRSGDGIGGDADRLVILDRGAVVAEIDPKDMSVVELTEYLIDLQHGS